MSERRATNAEAADSECICDFDIWCGGEGYVYCTGCGGDLCICAECYGRGMEEPVPCPGCVECIPGSEEREQ